MDLIKNREEDLGVSIIAIQDIKKTHARRFTKNPLTENQDKTLGAKQKIIQFQRMLSISENWSNSMKS